MLDCILRADYKKNRCLKQKLKIKNDGGKLMFKIDKTRVIITSVKGLKFSSGCENVLVSP